ncbi:MAG: 30S ribosomal protein S6 [Phototrophicales bacterium]|nr:MAG: 30S ribosomal protein S6 [Phototrophicales bacterium]
MKKPYEVTVVLRIENNEDVQKANLEQVKNWIEADGQGVINKLDANHWGRRRLAYEIDGQREGLYVLFYADIEPDAVEELDRNLRLATGVLRYLIVRPD